MAIITVALFGLASINVLTKRVATISGVSFTIAFFATFTLSERYNKRKPAAREEEHEKFRLETPEELSSGALRVRPGNVLVAVRNPHRLDHLRKILLKTDTRKMDIVVLSIRHVTQSGSGEHGLEHDQLFAKDEIEVFSKVVSLAEKTGKHVELLVVQGSDPVDAIVLTAARLQSSRMVLGVSGKSTPAEQGQAVGRRWEALPAPRPALSLEIIDEGRHSLFFNLGPHPPRLWPEDIERTHELWLRLTDQGLGSELHHRDVVGLALKRLDADLQNGQGQQVLEELRQELMHRASLPAQLES